MGSSGSLCSVRRASTTAVTGGPSSASNSTHIIAVPRTAVMSCPRHCAQSVTVTNQSDRRKTLASLSESDWNTPTHPRNRPETEKHPEKLAGCDGYVRIREYLRIRCVSGYGTSLDANAGPAGGHTPRAHPRGILDPPTRPGTSSPEFRGTRWVSALVRSTTLDQLMQLHIQVGSYDPTSVV